TASRWSPRRCGWPRSAPATSAHRPCTTRCTPRSNDSKPNTRKIEEQRMIALLLALQATVTEVLPADVSAAAAQTVAKASHGGINYLDLMLKASIPVKLIVLLLLAGSFISW